MGITVSRLHDTGRSAWQLLPYAVIVLGWVLFVEEAVGDDPSVFLEWYGVIWVLVSWAFVIRLLVICSRLGTVGSNQYGTQPGVVEESGWGDAELTLAECLGTKQRTTGFKSVLRFFGALGFGLLAVASAMILLVGFTLSALFVLSLMSIYSIEGPLPEEDDCGRNRPGTNSSLVDECEALVWVKDRLRGTGSLNWDWETAISRWDGVTIGRTPSRVTKVELNDKGLTGRIPPDLGTLFELTHLDLSDNSLRGNIPWELGGLYKLEELKLSGNSLTGCIPMVLRDVATNDLSLLNLPDCPPPAPGLPAAGASGEASVPLSWTAEPNASKYRVESLEVRRSSRGSSIRPAKLSDDVTTGTSLTVAGLKCETEYRFMVSAYGSGTTYGEVWSEPSERLAVSTGECVPPVFGASSYAFIVHVDAELGAVVGSVSATGSLTDDVVTYSIVRTRTSIAFAIDESTGQITVANHLISFDDKSFTLTVEASDESGGTATVTATIAVTRPAGAG